MLQPSYVRPPKPSAILSRLSDRTQSLRTRETDQKGLDVATPARPRTTSFVSARSAQKRDHAAEKWFTNIRQLEINNVDQPDGLQLLPRRSEPPKQRKIELRPRTDLNALFSPSATSLRVQTKRELGGDYTSYLPGRHADPYRSPMAYARLFLGRNKHIPLNAQTGALNTIQEAVRGKSTRQD